MEQYMLRMKTFKCMTVHSRFKPLFPPRVYIVKKASLNKKGLQISGNHHWYLKSIAHNGYGYCRVSMVMCTMLKEGSIIVG
jgi:hypothetical protein